MALLSSGDECFAQLLSNVREADLRNSVAAYLRFQTSKPGAAGMCAGLHDLGKATRRWAMPVSQLLQIM